MKKFSEYRVGFIYPKKLEEDKYYISRGDGIYVGKRNEIKIGNKYCCLDVQQNILKVYEKSGVDSEDKLLRELPDWEYYSSTYYALNLIKIYLKN